MTTDVCPLTAQHLEAADTLMDEIHRYHCDARPDFFQPVEGPLRDLPYWDSLMADPNVGLFIALEDGQPAGLLHLVLRETQLPMLARRRFVVVDTVVVASAFRRKGIGRKLMRRAEQWAAERGADSIELNVFEFNLPARALYEEMGFDLVSRRMSKKLNKG